MLNLSNLLILSAFNSSIAAEMGKKTKNIVILAAIIALAVFMRFYQLSETPPGLYPDIAINGNDALSSLQTGEYKLFYPENNGREGLMMWLDAASMAIFGINVLALKIPAAIAGVLTVFGIYLLCRQLFKNQQETIALLAAFFCAVLFWHINFSRIGFRVILMPLVLVFSFYFLWKSLRQSLDHKNSNNIALAPAIAGGIIFGLGFYTYTGFRLAVFLLFGVLLLWFFIYKKNEQIKKFIRLSLAMLLAVFFTALPIGIYFLQNPADFLGRAAQTSVFAAPNPPYELIKSVVLHLAMFNIAGDNNWRHNLLGAPELFLPVGILFLAGIAIAIWRSFGKNSLAEKLPYLALLLWFVVLLLPGALTCEGIPHSLRTLGVIPAAVIFCAVGGVALYQWLKSKLAKKILIPVVIIFIAVIILQSYYSYFVVWAKNSAVEAAFTANLVDIGNLTSQLHNDGWQTIVVVNENGVPVPYPDGIPMPAQTVMFVETENCYNTNGRNVIKSCRPYSSYIKPNQLNTISASAKTAIVPLKDEQQIFDQLISFYHQGKISTKNKITYFEIE